MPVLPRLPVAERVKLRPLFALRVERRRIAANYASIPPPARPPARPAGARMSACKATASVLFCKVYRGRLCCSEACARAAATLKETQCVSEILAELDSDKHDLVRTLVATTLTPGVMVISAVVMIIRTVVAIISTVIAIISNLIATFGAVVMIICTHCDIR